MPDNIQADAFAQEALGTDGRGLSYLGIESEVMVRLGSSSTYFVSVARPGAHAVGAFLHWGQTDIFFGGSEMDVSYGELP
jgi:hypothetical protein